MLLRIQEVENRVLGIIFIIYSVDNLGTFVDGPQDSFRASLSIQYSFFFFFIIVPLLVVTTFPFINSHLSCSPMPFVFT